MWDALTLDSDVTLQSGDAISVRNDLTLNATLAFPAAPGAAQVTFNGGNLSGNGQVVFGNGVVSYIFGNFTIGSGITLRAGSGSIGNGAVINEGTIIADGANQTLTVQGSPFTNRGTVEIKNGATFALAGTWSNRGVVRLNESTLNLGGVFTTADIGTIQRTGGTVKLAGLLDNTGATLALNDQTGTLVQEGGTIKGGRLTTSGGGALRAKSGTWDGLTLDGDLTLQDQDILGVRNGLTVNATLTLASLANSTGLFSLVGLSAAPVR